MRARQKKKRTVSPPARRDLACAFARRRHPHRVSPERTLTRHRWSARPPPCKSGICPRGTRLYLTFRRSIACICLLCPTSYPSTRYPKRQWLLAKGMTGNVLRDRCRRSLLHQQRCRSRECITKSSPIEQVYSPSGRRYFSFGWDQWSQTVDFTVNLAGIAHRCHRALRGVCRGSGGRLPPARATLT